MRKKDKIGKYLIGGLLMLLGIGMPVIAGTLMSAWIGGILGSLGVFIVILAGAS